MRQANATLVAFLASRQPFWVADLFTFELSDGTVYTWTSFDQDLFVPPYTYSAVGPLIDRTKWSIKNTVDVPEMEIRIFSNGSDLPGNVNLKLQVHNGLFDYSTITLSRIFMPTIGDTSLGAVDIFTGNAAQIEIDAISVVVTVKGANVQLAQYMPRNQFTPSCVHSLYDAGCAPNPGGVDGGPSRAANTSSNTVGASPTRSAIPWGGTPPATFANLALGYITFTSGVNDGQTRTIESATDAVINVAYPLYQVPAEGDTFTVTNGCDKSRGPLGCAFFANLNRWRGFPYIPPAEYGT